MHLTELTITYAVENQMNALGKFTNKGPHSPLCQDLPSIFQTLKLKNVQNYNPFCSLLGVLIIYYQLFCIFDHKDNVQASYIQ